MDRHTANKALIAPLRAAMYDFSQDGVRAALAAVLGSDALCRFAHPLGDMTGPDGLYDGAYAPLFDAVPDLERRDDIVMAGQTGHGDDWVGAAGYYTGVMTGPWLGIPPTGHQVHMRFHEFYRIAGGKVVEIQALWDIPEVMMQAGAWPMAPSLGREWHVPGPAPQNGLVPGPWDGPRARASCDHIVKMLQFLTKHPAEGGAEVMELERFWHPRLNWYGPAGIGTGRGIEGFRNWHQTPFLRGMPDRGQSDADITFHFFGDGDFAAVTGWPNMIQSVTGDGWMGIAPSGKRISLRSLDFWRIENRLIRENWVLIDILDVYRQLGVDVLARLGEFNKARNLGPIGPARRKEPT